MTHWQKIFQVDNRCGCHFYVMLSISYIPLRKKLSDASALKYILSQIIQNAMNHLLMRAFPNDTGKEVSWKGGCGS